jgi:phosphatidate cytidylyltransferase
MAPVLSPKKTIEGAVGGVIGAAALTMIYSYIFKSSLDLRLNDIVLIGLIGAVGALVSMIGDLAASAIKREYDIKDYGKLIPGHGGVLDRFDSIIITAPIVFFLANAFVNRI